MVMLRFDEPHTDVLPSDATESLEDLRVGEGATMPEVVIGVVGFAREFVADDGTVLQAVDREDGDSLYTQTVSVQAILRWDIDDQADAAAPGVIIARGVGGSSSERVAYALELRVINAGARIGELRWFWEDLDGNRYTAVGGQFKLTAASETILLTAVRRWSSQREVLVRYYLGDQLLNEAVADDVDIGGGTSGTTTIGARGDGPFAPGTASSVETTDMTAPRVEIDGSPGVLWDAVVSWATAGVAGNGKKLHIASYTADPPEVRDNEKYNTATEAWEAAPGTVGVLIDGSGGALTIAALEAFINAGTALLQVTTPDAVHAASFVFLDDGEVTEGTLAGGVDATGEYLDFFDGAIDELRVVGRELVAEEIAATWNRIRTIQPAGEQLIRDCMPPGLPISSDPTSRVQRETRMTGHALGYAAAQTENIRANLIPDRAYGPALTRWERITRQPSRPGDDVDIRRRRVLGHLARRAGVSQPGVRAALHDLLACDEDQLELIAYNNTIRDGFDTLRERRWRRTPEADWAVAGGELAVAIDAGEEPNALTPDWRTCLTGVSGPEHIGGYGAQIFAKVTPAFTDDGMEAGLVLYDWPRRDALLLGVRSDGGDIAVVSQRYIGGIAQPLVVHETTADDPHWLHLYQVPVDYSGQDPSDLVQHGVRWSTTSATAGFTTGNPGNFSFAVGWFGFYARTFDGALADPLAASFDDAALWMPHGTRPFHFYVLRDPDLPGEYDLAGANASISKLRQSHTHGAVITSRAFLAGNPESLCGRGPCGE